MFDCWTEKRWKMIRASEDLTVGIPIQLVNPAGSLVEWEYKRSMMYYKQLYWQFLISKSRHLVLYSYSISEPAGFTNKLKYKRSNLPMCGLFSSTFLSSSQTCIGDECKVIGSVIELMWLVRWKST